MTKKLKLSEISKKELNIYRKNLYFQDIIKNKILKINNFFTKENLDAAVIGLSGGIDSTLVALFFCEAAKRPDSPLEKIVFINASINVGTTGQVEAEQKVKVLESYIQKVYGDISNKLVFKYIDLTNAGLNYIKSDNSLNSTDFAKGQLASILRTPLFYYNAAQLQDLGYKSIVVGTTNKSESDYIGFFGKASDAMVDLQPIMDMFKYQVYKSVLHLVENNDLSIIINDDPKGDVYNGKTDEELIGACYDAVELFSYIKHKSITELMEKYPKSDVEQFVNIINCHIKNKHKYEVGKPSKTI